MSLSPRAERLLPRVRLLMSEVELALRDDRFDPATSERAFQIAATDDAIEIIVTGGTARAQPGRGRQRAAQDRHDTKSGGHRAGFCVGGSSGRHWIHDCYHAVNDRRALFQALSTQHLRVAAAIDRA